MSRSSHTKHFRRPGRPDDREERPQTGFALVIALSLMAFIVLLLLSLTTLVRVEARSAAQSLDQLAARQNALLGLQIALGELQKHAGPDQRVSAPASTIYPRKDGMQGEGPLFDDSTFGYRNFARKSDERSYLSSNETYLVPDERLDWDAALKNWWNPSNPEAPSDSKNPHWTGVLDSSLRMDHATDPNQDNPNNLPPQVYEEDHPDSTFPNVRHGEPDRNQPPVWLVSGNENFDIWGEYTSNPDSPFSYPDGYFTPDVELGDPQTEDDVVWLVNTGSASLPSESTDGLDGRVKAPLVSLPAANDTPKGGYAYWVGDESIKANFSVREPDNLATASPGTKEYRSRLQVPQRIGWENMRGFAASGYTISVNDPAFEKIVSYQQVPLVDSAFSDPNPDNDVNEAPIARNFHSITSHSRSLLTDQKLGGLKKDLTQYLEDGSGLNATDPIPSLQHYASNDPRFHAWNETGSGIPVQFSGTNNGFPTGSSPAQLDGIPTWGAIKGWYDSAGGGGSLNPSANEGIFAVISYFQMQLGFSYDASSNKMRLHMIPMIALWNPYDVDLNAANYRVEVDYTGSAGWKWYVAEDVMNNSGESNNWKLSQLQRDAGANWRADTDPTTDENGDGDPANDFIFDNIEGGSETLVTASGYGHPDYTDIGPIGNGNDSQLIPNDNTYSDGTTDGYGRFYYRMTDIRDDSDTQAQTWQSGGTRGVIGGKGFSVGQRQRFFGETGDEPIVFSINSSFAPGEVKVFTVGSTTQWDNPSDVIPLTNTYIADFPPSVWFNVAQLDPAPSSANELIYMGMFLNNGPGFSPNNVRVGLGGLSGGDIIFDTEDFATAVEFNDLDDFVWGRDLAYSADGVMGYRSGKGGEDFDGDGIINRDEHQNESPAFLGKWRPLYEFSDFDSNLRTQSGSTTEASNFSFGAAWLQPFTGSGVGRNETGNLHRYQPVFSRMNLMANNMNRNPMVERFRSKDDENNRNPDNDVEGLVNMTGIYASKDDAGFGGAGELKWDDGQANGSGNGFAVLTPTANESDFTALSQIAIRNARRANADILSLGQFQQVNLGTYSWRPAFPIGNSWASLYTDREAIAGIFSRWVGTNTSEIPRSVRPNNQRGVINMPSGNNIPIPGNTMVDLSYLLNEALWDRYFLSTITTNAPNLSEPLANSRLRFNENAAGASNSQLTDFDTSAAYLYNRGALNVNSTSVEAWKALLTAFRDLELRDVNVPGGDGPDEGTIPIARSLDPIGDSIGFHFDELTHGAREGDEYGNVSPSPPTVTRDLSKVMNGLRYMDDDMVESLAERIVDEVRLRGPFYSIADFVNRRLVEPDGANDSASSWFEARTDGLYSLSNNEVDYMNASGYDPFKGMQGITGALQRAIDLSGINGGVNHPDYGSDGNNSGNQNDIVYTPKVKNAGDKSAYSSHWNSSGIGGNSNNKWRNALVQEPTMRSHLDSEHIAGAPAGEAGMLMQGTAGFITQGDLLSMIGPALTARGDTFTVRSYGEVRSPVTGEITAKVWLESIVQRVYEPIQAADPTANDEEQWRPVSEFGRKFKIISTRRLLEEEI